MTTFTQRFALEDKAHSAFKLEQTPPLLTRHGQHKLPTSLKQAILAACFVAYPHAKRGEEALPDAEVIALMLGLRERLDQESAGAWAWALFEQWSRTDRWSSVIWLFKFLGTDEQAIRLLDRIKVHKTYFGKHAHGKHAAKALECMRFIDSPGAYAALACIKKTSQRALLRRVAAREIDEICAHHGWTLNHFLDRSVGDAGLDAQGTRHFDYGERHFTLRFRGAFDVVFEDQDGQLHERLPRARKTDDAQKAARAREQYASTQKQLKVLIKEQTERLHLAMIQAQLWGLRNWQTHLLAHPLMRHLARKLVWCTCDAQGRLLQTFLPDEHGALVGADYDVLIPQGTHVRLVYPDELSDEAFGAWTQVFADYALIQPFEQLAASLRHLLTHGDLAEVLARLPQDIEPGKVLGEEVYGNDWRDFHGWRTATIPSVLLCITLRHEHIQAQLQLRAYSGEPLSEALTPEVNLQLPVGLHFARRHVSRWERVAIEDVDLNFANRARYALLKLVRLAATAR